MLKLVVMQGMILALLCVAIGLSASFALTRFLTFFFFFNDTATTEIYTLSLHDALPILCVCALPLREREDYRTYPPVRRSEEHTSELQSRRDLVCRLLLEKKKKNQS